jgi:hypothetical protein
MKRQDFIRLSGVLAVCFALFAGFASCTGQTTTPMEQKEIYEWRIYSLNGDGAELDNFFRDILIPAYNRKGVKVGAFKPYNPEEQEMRYMVFIYPDLETCHRLKSEIWEDATFMNAAQEFYNTTAIVSNRLYSNYETYLSEAFSSIPVHRKPDSNRTLFEFRVYWSPNEEANKRKVRMFDEGEIDIFDKTGINSVLYGDIIAGPRTPALLYLTWYKDADTRAEAWSQFRVHPDWQRMSRDPQYANTATNNRNVLLSPMPYSQL